MAEPKEVIAAFDLDGTLTRRDTLIDFLLQTMGYRKLARGLFVTSPMLMKNLFGIVSNDIAKRMNKDSGGFYMPTNIPFAQRAQYAAGASGTGGAMVATNLLAGSFIEVLRNKARVMFGPANAHLLDKKGDHNKAEAALIARYGYNITEGKR